MLELTDCLAISSLLIFGAYLAFAMWILFEVTR